MGRLFGTDGIRGIAGRSPLTLREVRLLGRLAGQVLRTRSHSKSCRILAVRDTRGSGASLLNQLSLGLRESGIDVYDAGVLSTPSVAYLVRAHRFDSGVVISASHNPPQFNGIKFFTPQGRKWPEEWEAQIENRFFNSKKRDIKILPPKKIGHKVPSESLTLDYERFLIKTLGGRNDLSTLKVALDCSNGANSLIAPCVLRDLGVQISVIGNRPNGKNINVGCGSQHTESLAALVKRNRCHLGMAFDGDADRVIFVDEKGHEVDGDYVIALLAGDFKKRRLLRKNRVVITVMANLGLKKCLSRLGIKTIETPVGDRHVSEVMRQNELVLGGEQSGHIILGHYLPTGDGLLTALHVLAVVARNKSPFSRLVGIMKKYPQVLLNVPVKEKKPIDKLNGVQGTIDRIKDTLGSNGRILVRYSGTEPLLRIMIEGPDKKKLTSYANELAKQVRTHLA